MRANEGFQVWCGAWYIFFPRTVPGGFYSDISCGDSMISCFFSRHNFFPMPPTGKILLVLASLFLCGEFQIQYEIYFGIFFYGVDFLRHGYLRKVSHNIAEFLHFCPLHRAICLSAEFSPSPPNFYLTVQLSKNIYGFLPPLTALSLTFWVCF